VPHVISKMQLVDPSREPLLQPRQQLSTGPMEHAVQGSCLAQPEYVAARRTSPEVAFVLGAAASALLCLLIGLLAGFRRRGGSEQAVESNAADRLPKPRPTKLSLEEIIDDEARDERNSAGSTPSVPFPSRERSVSSGLGTPARGRRLSSLPDVRCSSQMGSPANALRTLNDGSPSFGSPGRRATASSELGSSSVQTSCDVGTMSPRTPSKTPGHFSENWPLAAAELRKSASGSSLKKGGPSSLRKSSSGSSLKWAPDAAREPLYIAAPTVRTSSYIYDRPPIYSSMTRDPDADP
jgi:hypothetical protein